VAVSKRWTVGLSDRGWVQRGRQAHCSWSSCERLVRIQNAKGWSKGFGENEVSPIGAIRLNAFSAPTAKRDATGEVQTVSLAKIAPVSNFAHANL